MGVYSWGFDKVLNQNPDVRCECNPEVMDLTVAKSWEWQKKPSSNYIEYMTPDARRKNAQTSVLVDQVGDQQNFELLLRCLTNAYNET